MNPKPHLRPHIKRPREKNVTIIAGFQCVDGTVVCADTQETISLGGNSSFKRRVPKLRFEQYEGHGRELSGLDTAVAICGAGFGPFIDKIADAVWSAAKIASDLPEACDAAEQAIKELYAEFGNIYQTGACPEVELIYSMKMKNESRLFHATGPIVNEKQGYSTAGSGCYMAAYIAGQMYHEGMTVRQGLILAAYVLFQTKEHADGCGGESHIALLRFLPESSGLIGWNRAEEITNLLKHSQDAIGRLIVDHGNLRIRKAEFLQKGAAALDLLSDLREQVREQLEDSDNFWEKLFDIKFDDLGLPKKLS